VSVNVIGRRKAIKYTGLLASTATGSEFLAKWLPSAAAAQSPHDPSTMPGMAHQDSKQPAEPYSPQFFKPEEFATVDLLTQIIIPTDDTPGAKEARVADYIDSVVFAAVEFEPSLQQEWLRGLAMLDQLSLKRFGSNFRKISDTDRQKLLMEMSLPERNPQAYHPGFDFYRLIKEMTVEAFYTSRVGLLEVLGYKGLTYLSEFPGCTHPEHQT